MKHEQKNKSPAFRFYPSDFLLGTMEMTDAEVGRYVKMLCAQWDRGSLPADPEKIKRLCKLERIPSEVIMAKFPVDEDMNCRNSRLEKERQKQIEFSVKKSIAGKVGGKVSASKRQATVEHTPSTDSSNRQAFQFPSSFSSSNQSEDGPAAEPESHEAFRRIVDDFGLATSLNPAARTELNTLLNLHGETRVRDALRRAKGKANRPIAYAAGILNREGGSQPDQAPQMKVGNW